MDAVAQLPDGEAVAATRSGGAPTVGVVLVAHDPGDWFEATLASIAAQDYPAISVQVVDTASTVPVGPRVLAVLPEAVVTRLDHNPGFGRAVDTVALDAVDAPFLLLCHDDVRLEPDVVRALVEEAFRSNAGVVGPKLVRWDDPASLLSAGEGADAFGFPVPYVERGELDQEQHDAVRDVFVVPDACTLVRTDLYRALGGADPGTSLFGDDLDLCWRAQVAGARVLVAPAARVGHLEALGNRRPTDDRRRLQFRHRLRTMLTAYGPLRLVLVLPLLLVIHLAEIVVALITGRPGQARDVAASWTWNLRRIGEVRARRRALKPLRRVPDRDIRKLQVRGSARLASFVRGQLGGGGGDSPLDQATSLGTRVVAALRGPGRGEAVLAWAFVVLVVGFGSRHLLTRPLPAIGELALLPDSVGALLSDLVGGWRRSGLGVESAAPTGVGLLTLAGAMVVGFTGLAREILVLGMLPLGLIGVWRLVAPVHSTRASVLALLAYTSIPLGYDALATGSWRGLVLYGITPWVLARTLRAAGTVPFGRADPPAGPLAPIPPWWRQTVALGLVLALGAAIEPLVVVLPLFIVVGLLPGSLLVGRAQGTLRMVGAAVGAGVLAVVLHLPWAWSLAEQGVDWSWFTGGRTTAAELPALSHLLRFDTGPVGSSALNLGLLVAAGFALLVGRGWRLEWAARCWTLALTAWGVVWAADQGWVPVALPRVDVLLAPAAVALAVAVGLGAAAFERDVRRSVFSWRQVGALVAVGALVVAVLPVLAASVSGRWQMPRGDHRTSLAFIAEEVAAEPFRVLWLGSPDVLPLTGWPLRDDLDLAYATTDAGLPSVVDLWPPGVEPTDGPVGAALEVALDGGTSRFGRVVGAMGVRYVVVVEQGAPVPYGGTVRPVADEVLRALGEQLDLEQVEVNPALTVYRNAAWVPMRAAVPAGELPTDADTVDDGLAAAARTDLAATARPVLSPTWPGPATGVLASGEELVVAGSPSARWQVGVDGARAPRTPVLGWANRFVADGGTATLELSRPPRFPLVAGGQAVAWVLVAALLVATRGERRGRRVPVGRASP